MASFPFQGFHHVTKEKGPPTAPLAWADFIECFVTEIDDELWKKTESQEQHLATGEVNELWIRYRKGEHGGKRATGSIVANAFGWGYSSIKQLKAPYAWEDLMAISTATKHYARVASEMIKDIFTGNKYTRWGNDHEDDCEEAFAQYHACTIGEGSLKSFSIEHHGLCLNKQEPWAGMSPDGVLVETWADGTVTKNLLEYKCPYSKKNLDAHATNLYGPMTDRFGNVYSCTPYYYCQVQWGMGLLHGCGVLQPKDGRVENLYCWFAVWVPAKVEVCKIAFDPEFYEKMQSKVRAFWFDVYLPAFYRATYPPLIETTWKGRSIQKMAQVLDFVDSNLTKKRCSKAIFYDWGCGEGRAMKAVRERFGFECVGVENFIPPKNFLTNTCTFHFPVDILTLDDVPEPSTTAAAAIHFVYDGGLYPQALSLKIAELVVRCARHETTFVYVLLNRYPAFDPDAHLEAKGWREALEGFTCLRAKPTIFETTAEEDRDGEPTMVLLGFYRKARIIH